LSSSRSTRAARGYSAGGARLLKAYPPCSPGPRGGVPRGQKKTGARLVVQSPAPVARHGNGDVRDGGGSSVCSCSPSVYAAGSILSSPAGRLPKGGPRRAGRYAPGALPAPRDLARARWRRGPRRTWPRAPCEAGEVLHAPRGPSGVGQGEGGTRGARGGVYARTGSARYGCQASACRRAARRAGWLLERGLKPRRRPLRRGMARRWTSKTSGPARGRRRLLSAPYAARGILPGVLTAARGGCMMAPLEMSPARGAANTPSAQKCPGDGVAVPGPGQQVLAAGASSVAHREARRHSLLAGPCCGLSVAGPGRRRAAQRHKRRCALSSFWRNDGEKWG